MKVLIAVALLAVTSIEAGLIGGYAAQPVLTYSAPQVAIAKVAAPAATSYANFNSVHVGQQAVVTKVAAAPAIAKVGIAAAPAVSYAAAPAISYAAAPAIAKVGVAPSYELGYKFH